MTAKPTFLLAAAAVFPLAAQVNVLTYQYDDSRAGYNAAETALTPAAVNANQFGKLFSYSVDGYVYAQPLYVANVTVAGRGSHNVVFVATEHDSIYALDADGPGAPASGPLWQVSFLDPDSGVTSVPAADTGCDQILPEIGITGTPVIDSRSGTLYAVAMTKEYVNGSPTYVHRLHALDIASGQERPGSPVVIHAAVVGTGDGGTAVVFNPSQYKQRPGLLLLHGTVYAGFSSHCDGGQYHGWLMGYDEQTLQQVTVYNNTPNGNQGSFWAGGAAPAADAAGYIYLVSGNGSWNYNVGGGDLGESYIKLSAAPQLSVADYFAPYNQQALSTADLDTGSAGVALLGDEAGSTQHPHLLVGAGKEGRIYLLDRDHMGGWQAGSDSQIVQSLPGAIGGLFGNPAYFNQTVYFCGSGDGVFAFPISNAQMAATPSSNTPTQYGYPGCVPTVSANGVSDAIVWTLESSNTLHAYAANDLSSELFNSNQNPGRDALDSYVKYSIPTVANGKVFAATQTQLAVFGLLPAGASLAANNAASGDPVLVAPGSIVSIYGQGLAATAGTSPAYPLPGATVGGASVTMNGWPAPVFYASPTQLNVQVPFELGSGAAAVSVRVNGVPTNLGTLSVQASGPGIFLIGQGRAAVLNQDYSVNSTARPAPVGSVLMLFGNGLGPMNPSVATGVAPGAAPVSNATGTVTASIGGASAAVWFAGGAPGFAGLDQVNILVPQLAPGDYPVQIFQGGVASNAATITVR